MCHSPQLPAADTQPGPQAHPGPRVFFPSGGVSVSLSCLQYLKLKKKNYGRNKHWGKISPVSSMDFIFMSALKVSFHFYTICFDFSSAFHHNKVTT